jgi:hypothetical protein
MRKPLILVSLGILSAAVWPVSSDVRAHGGHGSSSHGGHGHGSESELRRIENRTLHVGMFVPTQFVTGVPPEPGPPLPDLLTGGLAVGSPEHLVEGHLGAPNAHHHAHALLRFEGGQTSRSQPISPRNTEPAEDDQLTVQPNRAANPWLPRPPGAAGPGRPVSGSPSPGRRGPGRPVSPRS